MEKKTIRVVCFDFDGTIGETEPDIRNAWKNVFRTLGLKCGHFDEIFRVGPSLPEMSAWLFPAAGDAELETIRATYKKFYDESDMADTPAYPWCEEILGKLHAQGKKLYIVTNKRIKPTLTLLRKFKFEQFFSGIFTPDIVPRHPLTKNELAGLAVRVSGADAENCLMVGDTRLDILAAKSAKMHSCGVTWGYGTEAELVEAGADYLAADGEEFLSGFQKRFE